MRMLQAISAVRPSLPRAAVVVLGASGAMIAALGRTTADLCASILNGTAWLQVHFWASSCNVNIEAGA